MLEELSDSHGWQHTELLSLTGQIRAQMRRMFGYGVGAVVLALLGIMVFQLPAILFEPSRLGIGLAIAAVVAYGGAFANGLSAARASARRKRAARLPGFTPKDNEALLCAGACDGLIKNSAGRVHKHQFIAYLTTNRLVYIDSRTENVIASFPLTRIKTVTRNGDRLTVSDGAQECAAGVETEIWLDYLRWVLLARAALQLKSTSVNVTDSIVRYNVKQSDAPEDIVAAAQAKVDELMASHEVV